MSQPTKDEVPRVSDTEAIRQMLVRAERGDQDVLPQLRAFFDERPDVWRKVGDLAEHARTALINRAAGTSLVAAEAICRKMAALQAELAGPAPPPLERLLVERVVICWLQSYLADVDAVAQGRGATPLAASVLKRQDAAQRRYLQAIKALATVRRLLRPPVSPVELAFKTTPEAVGQRGRGGGRADLAAVIN